MRVISVQSIDARFETRQVAKITVRLSEIFIASSGMLCADVGDRVGLPEFLEALDRIVCPTALQ